MGTRALTALLVAACAAACSRDAPPPPATPSPSAAPATSAAAAPEPSPRPDVAKPAAPVAPRASEPTRYPPRRIHSPLTAGVAARLRKAMKRGPGLRDDVFMKVGASGSESEYLMSCFATGPVEWGAWEHLAPHAAVFKAARVDGVTPFDRQSLAARRGQTAAWAIRGDPAPLEQEVADASGRFALVAYGTNDMGMGVTYHAALRPFAKSLLVLVDRLLARGVIPVLGTPAPRHDRPAASLWIPTYNAIVHAIAQGRQVPLLDLHTAYLALPNHGRATDNLHANVYFRDGVAHPCVFTDEGMAHGYNVRNLSTMRVLARLHQLAGGAERGFEPDADEAPLAGRGSAANPHPVPELPFVDLRDISRSPHLDLDRYTGCGASQDQSGPEVVYRLRLERTTRLRIALVGLRDGVDVDLHVLGGEATPGACRARHDDLLQGQLHAGTYHVVVDTFVEDGAPRWGEYALAILPCSADDPACAGPLAGR